MINKIKNDIFFKSTFILLVGGTFGKLVGFILKIIITRNLKAEGMGLYSMLNPTISLITVISTFSLPTAISKVVSSKNISYKKLLYSLVPITLFTNIILIIIMIYFSPILANNMLKEPSLYYPIICISLTAPFITISSIIKGYFWGKQNMFPYMLSNFIEQIARLILISILITKIITYGNIVTICFIFIVNMIGEIISQIVMILFFPKKDINLSNISFDVNIIKKIANTTLPLTSSKIIGTISYFFEPIILTNMLLFMGYTKEYIIYEYGIINAYALSLLLMPQFFIQNMSTSLVPELSKYYSLNNKKMCIKRIKQIVFTSALIGLIGTSIILIIPKTLLNILYHTTEGIEYIKILSPFIILFYIEGPLSSSLQALNKSKTAMYYSIIGSLVRLISIVIFSLLHLGMYSYILSIIINLVLSTYIYYKAIKKCLT